MASPVWLHTAAAAVAAAAAAAAAMAAVAHIVDRVLKDTWHCVVWYSMV